MHEIKKDICYIDHMTHAEDRCGHLNK